MMSYLLYHHTGKSIMQLIIDGYVNLDEHREFLRETDHHHHYVHLACSHPSVKFEIVERLISITGRRVLSKEMDDGLAPIHHLCCNQELDKSEAVKILQLLVLKEPNSVRAWSHHKLPIHLAINSNMSSEFVRLLIKLSSPYDFPNHKDDLFQLLLGGYDVVDELEDFIRKTPYYHYVHFACSLSSITLNNVQRLMRFTDQNDVWVYDDDGYMPIHRICCNNELDKSEAMKILLHLLQVDAETTREWISIGGEECLPIHLAIESKMSPEFISQLVRVFPESLFDGINDAEDDAFIRDATLTLASYPLHVSAMSSSACHYRGEDDINILKVLYSGNPDTINKRDRNWSLPIHLAVCHSEFRESDGFGPNLEIIKFLLDARAPSYDEDLDRDQKCPLHVYCDSVYRNSDHSHYRSGLDEDVLLILYNAYPEAIIDCNMSKFKYPLHEFLRKEKIYVDQSQHGAHHAEDSSGWLPLHQALYEEAALGSIKLLVKASNGWNNLDKTDAKGNNPLHVACIGGNYQIINHLMKIPRSSAWISKCNINKELPIHLFGSYAPSAFEPNPEFVDTSYRLLQAHPESRYPETVTDIAMDSDDESLFSN
jgi:ankyrin repeat protein